MTFLDTHVVVWRALHPEKIPARTRRLLDQEEKKKALRVCEITLFEIAMLMRRGRLRTDLPYREFMELALAANDYILVGLNPDIAARSVDFSGDVNKDPADRLILASALHYKGKLVTADANLRQAAVVTTVW